MNWSVVFVTKEWEPVDLLRHYRHDWLNQMQLIKGNLALGKIERVETLLEDIIIQSKNEAKLSNMEGKTLAEKLLTFNWEPHDFHLNFEVISEPSGFSRNEPAILKVSERLFAWFDRQCQTGADNHLLFVINSDNGKPVIEFDFQGKLNLDAFSIEEIEQMSAGLPNVYMKEVELGNHECFIRIHFSD
ncbi:hypothetical protein CR205_09700 [Alteribacter lacisalsi]|uniref:Sporulation initiation phosphotransferase B C-terminal domain-containing protein n=1 Tax=Alteribacter lacisalsi TaxID=2045244 RepID=A0A2W0HP10_9BACI|nr:Spo0B C-terminal domain-containing protein [Alteribacter lacisalsi]PYZ98822.1 hypothetical protein CR205_09700 [Alteribacter lacisalsi]